LLTPGNYAQLPDAPSAAWWPSIDFTRQLRTVEGPTAKTRQTRHVPLNDEALSVLRRWRYLRHHFAFRFVQHGVPLNTGPARPQLNCHDGIG
jgi:integrase